MTYVTARSAAARKAGKVRGIIFYIHAHLYSFTHVYFLIAGSGIQA